MAARHSMILVCAGTAAASLSLPAQGDKVQGTATLGKTKVTLANGMAVDYKAPNGQMLTVGLTDKPVDAKEFASDTRVGPGDPLVMGMFEGALKSQHIAKKYSGFAFTIGPNGLISEAFLIGGEDAMYSIGNEQYDLTVKSRTPRLVGTIKTKTPIVDLGGGRTAGTDATFDLAVTKR